MRIRIGSFNLFNLALPEIPYYENMKYSHGDYQKKVNWTATQLRAMDCDLVGFQEIFHKKALDAVVAESGLYPGVVSIVPNEVGDKPRVGLVTRLPVLSYESITDFPANCEIKNEEIKIPNKQFRRPVLKVKIQLPTGQNAVVFVVHLKSKRPTIEDESKRFSFMEMAKGEVLSLLHRGMEAMALRSLVLAETERTRTPVIVVGDFNDSAHSVTSEIILGKPPEFFYPQDIKLRIWDTLLYLTSDIQIKKGFRDVFYTHMQNNQYESLDHILVSEEFVAENPKHIGLVEYVRYLNDHLFESYESAEEFKNWQSDHGQVVASIRLG